jgi:hypothetical protein
MRDKGRIWVFSGKTAEAEVGLSRVERYGLVQYCSLEMTGRTPLNYR